MNGRTANRRKMAECNVDLSPEKMCKYSYASWCPTCDRESPRRRTKSDSYESCRKKGREMKTFTPKKLDHRRCEYENYDKEHDMHDVRYERVRSNLCELPTSYISNNCQLGLTHTKLSVTADYLGAKSPNYENSYVLKNDCGNPPSTRCEFMMPDKKRHGVILPPSKRTTHMAQPHLFHARSVPSNSSSISDISLVQRSRSPPIIRGNPSSFLDKHFDAKLVRERYTRELEILREKLKDLHNHKYNMVHAPAIIRNLDRSPTRSTIASINLDDIKVIEDVEDPRIDGSEKYNQPPPKTSVKAVIARVARAKDSKTSGKVTVKTVKARVASGKPSKLKVKMLKTPSCSFSEESDQSDYELIPQESFFEQQMLQMQRAESTTIKPQSPSETEAPSTQDSGDAPLWPVRYSLFPNIPPYIKFSMHSDEPNKLPSGRRHMKWKLSTITPVVVRKTLLNTGFRLVRIGDDIILDEKIRSAKWYLDNYQRKYAKNNNCAKLAESNDWTGTWGKHMKSPMFRTLKSCQKLNHFAGTFQLGRKDRLWKNVQRLMHRFGLKEFGFIPQTFVLPHDLKALKQSWECKDGSAGERWIIKPPASARGVGIKVINKWSQLPKQGSVVVQKYISDPYLINGSKFDLRLYVLVTSFNPLRIYLYPEGLVRFASVKYSGNDKDLKDRFMHLTNYSINKMSSQYTANEDANACQGHKWTLTKLWEYLSDRGVDTNYLWESLQQLVIKTMISGESPITQLCNENISNRYNCYELFGVDVLFDERLKPWLLEVNISPSLHSTSPLDLHVKGPLVQTLFNLAQFHLPPKIARSNESAPQCYDPRIYTTTLTAQEASKHNFFVQMERRSDYLEEILNELTGDDIRHLTQAEDELVVKGRFERIFPSASSHKYLDFIPVRYYNRLFDAWESFYEERREEGIQLLKTLCAKRLHLKVQPPPAGTKNLHNTSPGTSTNARNYVDERLLSKSFQIKEIKPPHHAKKTDFSAHQQL